MHDIYPRVVIIDSIVNDSNRVLVSVAYSISYLTSEFFRYLFVNKKLRCQIPTMCFPLMLYTT